jgi:hypothetical protein
MIIKLEQKLTTFQCPNGNFNNTFEALEKMSWKICVLIVALTAGGAFGDYVSRWVPQRVNQFDPSDHRQWDMVRLR